MKRFIIHFYLISEPLNKRMFMGEFENKDQAIKQLRSYIDNIDIVIFEIVEMEN
ncbi:MAG: hypothetical protein LLF98_02500 [Clostridium sp.]|uniref:hypothetical protein n=1 Tax=Clostridium sp. TaxID=1506 RepID=UPI0025C242A5|nr:hypothetical protein [Clostridium sp.]MCE5220153.1 hypothetical protein [Clostridium sp.]